MVNPSQGIQGSLGFVGFSPHLLLSLSKFLSVLPILVHILASVLLLLSLQNAIFLFNCFHSSKKSTCKCKKCRFDPWVGKIPWRRKWQPTPVFLPGQFRGERSLGDCSHAVAKSWTWLSNWGTTKKLEWNVFHVNFVSVSEVQSKYSLKYCLPLYQASQLH